MDDTGAKLSDGETVGLSLGVSDGDDEFITVGTPDGSWVITDGSWDGLREGSWDGLREGTCDGSREGTWDGCNDGHILGSYDGDGDGDGIELPSDDGCTVGIFEGVFRCVLEGILLGEQVG